MVANVLAARALIAMVVAAAIGTWGVMAHPVNTENPFLALIALQNPPVFHALAYGYATLWFSTTFFAASLVLSMFTIVALGRTPRIRPRALPPYPSVSAVDRARTLLENIRRTPMMRSGRLLEHRRMLKAHIESAMVDHNVPDRLAARMAFQLVLKCPANHLGDAAVWDAIGIQVHDELDRLRLRLGLTDRLLTVGVPKLSADDIERLFDEMRGVDSRYGRTLAEAALDGAEPWAMARRYGKAFTDAVRRLTSKNPRVARTLAAAAFRSRHPLANALEYLSRFDTLVQEFEGNVGFARTVAKAAFIAPDPVRAARKFVRDYRTVVRELTAEGMEPSIARSLAGIAALCGKPLKTARTLVEKFREVENIVKRTHPQIARSVALAVVARLIL